MAHGCPEVMRFVVQIDVAVVGNRAAGPIEEEPGKPELGLQRRDSQPTKAETGLVGGVEEADQTRCDELEGR